MLNSYTDIPVPSLSEDKFDIKVYVKSMSEFISKCDTPMTIAIQGDWGSGKTSMMNMIKEQLGDDVLIAWFNTWQFSQFGMSSQLSFSFLTYLTEMFSDNKKEFLKDLGKIAVGFGRFLAKVAIENVAGGEAAHVIDNIGPEVADYAKQVIALKEKFQNEIKNKLDKEGKSKIVIFVDDLDRVPPETAVELLETLKLFVDVEKCVFILAIDYDVVAQGVRKKYGELMTEDKGKSFFDKIIQLPFKMPVGLYNLDNYVKQTLLDFGINKDIDDKELDIYKGLIFNSIGQNPRTLKRLFNSFRLINLIIQANKGKEDQDTNRILFGILCMQMKYEDLYNYLVIVRSSLDAHIMKIDSADVIRELIYPYKNVDDKQVAGILAFWRTFMEAIQLDDDTELSQKEIENFRRILGFSSVTSNQSASEQEALDFEKRYKIRDVTKSYLSLANNIFNLGFKLYQSNTEERACIYAFYQLNELKNELCVYIDVVEDEYSLDIFIQNKQKSYKDKFIKHIKNSFSERSPNITDLGHIKAQFMEIRTGIQYKQSAEEVGKTCFEKTKDVLEYLCGIIDGLPQ